MADEAKRGMLQGKNKILMFRLQKDSDTEAAKLSFQTGHTFSLTRDSDAITTKDGTIVKLGELEGEVTGIEAVQAKEDPVAEVLQTAILDGERLELWEVTVDDDLKNEEGKYPAMYAQGYLTSWESEPSAEDEATYSGDYSIDLVPQFGFVSLDPETEEKVQYAFKDITAETGGEV